MAQLYIPVQNPVTKEAGIVSREWQLFFQKLIQQLGIGQTTGFLKAQVPVTNADILTLPSVYLEAVPAPGADHYLLLHRWTLVIDATAGGYTFDPAALGLSVAYGNWAVDGATFEHFNAGADVLIFAGGPYVDTSSTAYPPYSNGPNDEASIGNVPFKLIADNNGVADFGGGDPANTGTLTVYYTVEDL